MSGDHMGAGMDNAWFASLETAMRERMAWDEPHPQSYGAP